MTVHGRAYISAVIVFGFVVVVSSVRELIIEPIGYQWFVLVALTLVSGSATVRLPSVPASISISETFVFAAVLLYGPAAGALIVALDGLVISYWIAKRRHEPYRAWFNMSAPAVSVWCSAHLFFAIARVSPLTSEPILFGESLNRILPSLFVFALTYFGLNSWLIAFAVSAETGIAPSKVWWNNFVWLSLNYFCGASVAVLLVVSTRQVDVRFLTLILPLLLVLYFTFKTSMDRVTDANKHVALVDRLYLSTIETLAMAIDAKDQITHGHIRRVQSYAIGLARHMGIKDDKLIKAIEAAALLHDMGKLAVPEYILNKPGKLTDTEFDKMKLHASVGADILSAIEFPYPVVPIVRHHHENWNGTGYPAGLKGTDIPIGARILAVVDCFDALTSDRPYRPRLSDEAALKILMDRCGSMYDPLVVQTFIKVYADITTEIPAPQLPRHALHEITSAMQPVAVPSATPRLEQIAASADEMLTLYELARVLAGHTTVSDAADLIATHLKKLVPFTQLALYLYDAVHDELEARHAIGSSAHSLRGLRIPLGQRLSGWVAVNRQTIVNSDPALDLGEGARAASPRLRSCISTPLIHNDDLVGVLSLYSHESDAFGDDDRRIIEIIAKQIGHTFKCAADFERATKRDALTGLPSLHQLEQLIDETGTEALTVGADVSLILVDVINLPEINNRFGEYASDEVLRHVVKCARGGLRVADILFRYGRHQFVALLNRIDPDTAVSIASKIRSNICSHKLMLQGGATLDVSVAVQLVASPRDGRTFRELITAAHTRSDARTSDSVRVSSTGVS